jgi:nitrite reductase/ring-hydroxylating ferredoxin subunit
MTWARACKADLAAGECKGVVADGKPVAIFNIDGSFHATSNVCTHQFALLTEGYLDGCVIECPLHQGRFDVRTGVAEGDPVTRDIQVYPIRIEGGEVFVDV